MAGIRVAHIKRDIYTNSAPFSPTSHPSPVSHRFSLSRTSLQFNNLATPAPSARHPPAHFKLIQIRNIRSPQSSASFCLYTPLYTTPRRFSTTFLARQVTVDGLYRKI